MAGGNDTAFWQALIWRIALGPAWRLALHCWPVTLLGLGAIARLI
ncbi:hypothetical protein [Chelativorans salis]|uniref:Uncharacterized protein n=1 Tax=Chelativorans salis TaxID=2978478 RepID=A0ABT2LLS1_9HYPH|nr:hypothetical protein [Chelativorans sp. EGI FJ00035]MCT7375473.1 hypothetical protein [Chelativorans sp. EGI FJ00035]